jgi:hypothetical protein
MKIKVAICKTNRIARDPIDYFVELEAEWVLQFGKKRLSVKCPRWPKGLFPGVWVGDGIPMIAARDMHPMPPTRRRMSWAQRQFNRRYNQH